MPNGLRIEHFSDIIPKAQSWLVLNLQFSCLFTFISMYPRPEQQIWLEMHQMKIFIDMEQSPLSMLFAFINLVCVQSVIQLMISFITFVL